MAEYSILVVSDYLRLPLNVCNKSTVSACYLIRQLRLGTISTSDSRKWSSVYNCRSSAL